MQIPKLARLALLLCIFVNGASCLPINDIPTVHPDPQLEPLIKDYLENSRFDELCDLKVKLGEMAPSDEVDIAQAIDFIQAGLDLMGHQCTNATHMTADLALEDEGDAERVVANSPTSPQFQFPDYEMATENLLEPYDTDLSSPEEAGFLRTFEDSESINKSASTSLIAYGVLALAGLSIFLACCVKGCHRKKRKGEETRSAHSESDLEVV